MRYLESRDRPPILLVMAGWFGSFGDLRPGEFQGCRVAHIHTTSVCRTITPTRRRSTVKPLHPTQGPIAIVLVSLVVLLGACSSSDDEEAEALAVVEDAYELYNSGDAAGWVEVRDLGSHYGSDAARVSALAFELEETEAAMTANAHYEVTECVWQGSGEWPGIADRGGPVAVGDYFICETVLASDSADFGGPETFNWVVSDGAVVAVNSD